MRLLLCIVALGLCCAAPAGAGFVPAWSYVPAPLRASLAAQSGGTLYLPARAPSFYRYRSGAAVVNRRLVVTFRNRVRVRQGVWRWTNRTFLWQVFPLATTRACSSWATVKQTYQVSGNRVYGGTAAVWRCVVDRFGKAHVLAASERGTLPGSGLAGVVASGLDVSTRTSALRVAIVVTPSTVRRGRTILVHGLATGCASGDAVTLISRAFPAAHSFAGVPAVFAQVGSAGRFSAVVRIPATRRPGSYTVTGRCGGGNLGVTAHVTVTR